MPNLEHLKILEQGLEVWDRWRSKYPRIIPDLSCVYFEEFDSKGINFENAILSETCFIRANLEGANLAGAMLEGANLEGANLTRADLHCADLSDANLSGANFEETNLVGATLNRANLSYAYFLGTDFSNSSLIGANLQYASLALIKVSGADFRKAILTQEKDDPINFLELCFSEGLVTATFSDANFLQDYLAKAFEYAHQPDTRKKLGLSDFLDDAINSIAAMRNLYNAQQSPEHVIEVVGVITSELINYLKKHPKALYEIKPRQFEELIAEILASYGWQVDLTPSTRDGGYDIYAISPISGKETTSWIIECKKYAPENKVGVDLVRALYGLRMDLQIANAMLATTSYFSRDARAYKASRYDLKLHDYEGVLEWINQYRPNPNGILYIKDNRLIVPGKD